MSSTRSASRRLTAGSTTRLSSWIAKNKVASYYRKVSVFWAEKGVSLSEQGVKVFNSNGSATCYQRTYE